MKRASVFAGADLSSNTGLLLIKEFSCKLGFVKRLKPLFKTNDTVLLRHHKDDEKLWQVICQILVLILKMSAPVNLFMILY